MGSNLVLSTLQDRNGQCQSQDRFLHPILIQSWKRKIRKIIGSQTDKRQPTTDNRQPTTDNRQPTTDNRQTDKNDQKCRLWKWTSTQQLSEEQFFVEVKILTGFCCLYLLCQYFVVLTNISSVNVASYVYL